MCIDINESVLISSQIKQAIKFIKGSAYKEFKKIKNNKIDATLG